VLRFAFQPRHPITQVAFTADGREVVTAQPFTGIAVRDRLTGEPGVNFPLPKVTRFHALMVHPEFGWIASHTDRGPKVYDLKCRAAKELYGQLAEPGGRFFSRWADTGESFPQLGPTLPRYWTGNLRVGMTADERASLWVRFEGVPQLAAFPPADVVVQLNSPLRGRSVQFLRAVIAFSPDGLKLALGDGETLAVFDLTPVSHFFDSIAMERATLDPLLTLERPDPSQHGTHADKQAEHWLPPVAFDHAGRTLFTLGLRNRVQRIDLATGGVMGEWGWRCEPIRSLAVSPDDLTAAAGCQRGELVLWDLE
jgi:WD40 repeat protein